MAKISGPERTSKTSWSPTCPSRVSPLKSLNTMPCARSGPAGGACSSAMFTPSIVPAIDEPHSISGRHAEEFLAGQGVVAETAQHAAGDQIRAGLVYAAGGHELMRRLDD